MSAPNDLDLFVVIMGLLGGLVMFLVGVDMMSEGLKAAAGERMKDLLAKLTTNRVAAVVTGAVATAVLDSSSAVTILVVGLVNARLLTLTQALGVIMGANIGTTLSDFIYALDVLQYAPLLMAGGFVLRLQGRSERFAQVGGILLGLGLVFFGLNTIDGAVSPLKDHKAFEDMIRRLESPPLGAAVGALVTAVIQSSSATVAIVIRMARQGAISLAAGVAIMMGAEIGTCLDTLVATVGRSREAVRAGVFQLLFNVASVALWIGFAGPLASLAVWVSTHIGPSAEVRWQIADAHVIFNVSGVLVFLPFLRTMARAVEWLIPDRPGKQPDDPDEDAQGSGSRTGTGPESAPSNAEGAGVATP